MAMAMSIYRTLCVLLYLFQFVLQLGTKLQLLAGMNTFRIENGDQSKILKEKPVHWTLLSLKTKTQTPTNPPPT